MADVENRVPCHPDTVMRIASISKSMTMAVVAKLWQDGKLDLDKPVQSYVPSFPTKTFNKEQVTITTKQLVSHLAGIRHYEKTSNSSGKNKETASKEVKDKKNKEEANSAAAKNSDSSKKEFYIKERFESVQEALKLFQDDDLVLKPGTSFSYSTHGWTLVSAVVEAAAGDPFTVVMKKFFQVMGLKYTYLDEPRPLIYNRSGYYHKTKTGRLENVPYVDNSWKWAGGGFLSTVGDLLRFGNAMIYSYQWRSELGNSHPPGYLQAETIQAMWTPQSRSQSAAWGRDSGYGMGWKVVPSVQEYGGGDAQKFAVGHDGAAVGASSILLMVPTNVPHPSATTVPVSPHVLASPNSLSVVSQTADICIPCGVVVAIISNLEDVGLRRLAADIAALFCETVTPPSGTNPYV